MLFVFQQSRDVRIVTGYGLEGVLPDALCKQIIERRYAGTLSFARLGSNRTARTKIQRQTTND